MKTAGLVEQLFSPDRVAQIEYFVKNAPGVDWQSLFLVGIFVGALIASLTDGSFRLQKLPPLWEGCFGASIGKRG